MSKNNQNEILRKMQPQRQRYGLRKLTIGVASVLLGTTILIGGGTVAHADGPADTNTGTNSPAATSSQEQTGNNRQTVAVKGQGQTDSQGNSTNQAKNNPVKQPTTDTANQNSQPTAGSTDQTLTNSTDHSSTGSTQGTPMMVLPAVNPTSEDSTKTVGTENAKTTTDKITKTETEAVNIKKLLKLGGSNPFISLYQVGGVWADTEAPGYSDTANQVTVTITFYTADGSTIGDSDGVRITTVKGQSLKDVIGRFLADQLKDQEAYYGPDGNDYMYDSTTNEKIGVSPVVAQLLTDSGMNTTGTTSDDYASANSQVISAYNTWKEYKAEHFPYAGYEWDSDNNTDITIDSSSDEIVFLKDPGYTSYSYVNVWEEIDRKIEFKKYYSDSDVATDSAKKAADDIAAANTKAGKIIATSGFTPKMAVGNNTSSVETTVDNLNSTTSTVTGHPVTTADNNQILYKFVTQRKYDSVTGTVDSTSTASSGSNSGAIQFPAVEVERELQDSEGGNWTTFQNSIPETGADNFHTAAGINTYGFDTNGNFIRGITKITNPAAEYVFYYHNQPVKVVFKDVTSSTTSPTTLSAYTAKELNVKDNSVYDPSVISTSLTSLEQAVTRAQENVDEHPGVVGFENMLKRAQQALNDVKNSSYTAYSYQADSNKYTTTASNIIDNANGKITTDGDLDYSNILKAYEDAGYVFVSADPDNLTYDKDKVWDNSNNTHSLLTQTVTVKLRKAAKAVTAVKQVNRTIHYVANSTSGDELLNDSTQTVNLKAAGLYLDGSQTYSTTPTTTANTEVQDAAGNTYYVSANAFVNTTTITDAAGNSQTVVDPTNTTQITPTWTIDTSKTNNGVTADSTANQFDFAKVDTPATINDSTTGRTDKDKDSTWVLVDTQDNDQA